MARHRSDPVARLAVLSVAIAWIATLPAEAQRTEFYPSLGVEGVYMSDALFVEDGPAASSDDSDSIGRLELTLPVRREWTGRSWELSYDGAVERYRDFDQLDNDAHRLRTAYTSRTTPGSGYELTLSYDRTQAQGDPASLDPSDLVIGERADRDRYRAVARYDRAVGRRWRMFASAAGSRTRYDPIAGVTTAPIDDRDRYGAGLAVRRSISRSTSLGGSYRFARFSLDRRGDQDNHFLGVSLRHEPGRVLAIEAELGASRRQSDIPGVVDETNVEGRISVTRALRRMELALSAERVPSSGGVSDGTAVDTAAGVYVSGTPRGPWRWSASTRYAVRDPNLPGFSETTSVAGQAGLEWFFHDTMSFGADALWVDQSESSEFNGSFTVASARIRWYPRGHGLRRRGDRS